MATRPLASLRLRPQALARIIAGRQRGQRSRISLRWKLQSLSSSGLRGDTACATGYRAGVSKRQGGVAAYNEDPHHRDPPFGGGPGQKPGLPFGAVATETRDESLSLELSVTPEGRRLMPS